MGKYPGSRADNLGSSWEWGGREGEAEMHWRKRAALRPLSSSIISLTSMTPQCNVSLNLKSHETIASVQDTLDLNQPACLLYAR